MGRFVPLTLAASWLSWFALLAGIVVGQARAAEPEGRLGAKLRRPVSAMWQDLPLRGALDQFAEQGGVSLWLDRRVDPDQTLDFSARDIMLGEFFEQVAQDRSLQVAYVSEVVYLGPGESAAELSALREKLRAELERLPFDVRRQWLQKASWSWPRLSEPRALLSDLFRSSQIELRGADRIAHDLWAAKKLPSLALLDRALLLLVGFDCTLQIDKDGKSCEVVPIERPIVFTRTYPLPTGRQPAVGELRRRFPSLRIQQVGQKMAVIGQWHPQQELKAVLTGEDTKTPDGRPSSRRAPLARPQVYSLRVQEKPVGQVLKQLALQFPFEIAWDARQIEAAGRSLETRISCELQSVDEDRLLEGVLAPAGLRFRREGNRIRIEAKPTDRPNARQ